jgi:hypothetical protein
MQHIYNKSNKPVILVLYSAHLHDHIGTRDLSGHDVPYLDNGQYQLIINDVNYALHHGHPFRISIYPDASGNTFAKDSNANDINDRLVITTIYTYPYMDYIQNITVPGDFKVIFDDGSYFENTDEYETSYWYTVVGAEPVEIKQFT